MEFKSKGEKYDSAFSLIPTICYELMAGLLQRRWGGASWFFYKTWFLLCSCSQSEVLIYALAFSLLCAHLTGK